MYIIKKVAWINYFCVSAKQLFHISSSVHGQNSILIITEVYSDWQVQHFYCFPDMDYVLCKKAPISTVSHELTK